jgi:hypothetical protein
VATVLLRTFANGPFLLRVRPLGEYAFAFGPRVCGFHTTLSLHVAGVLDRRFELPGNRLEVLVLDPDRGRGVPGVLVELSAVDADRDDAPLPALTTSDGTVQFEFVPDGAWRLLARRGDESADHRLAAAQISPIELQGGEEESLLVQLAREPALDITVLDSEGKPVSGAQLYWRDELGRLATDQAVPENVSDENGRIAARGLPLGPSILVAKHFELGQGERAVALESRTNPPVVIHLAPLVDVSLAFQGAEGEPHVPLQLRSIRDASGDLQPFARVSQVRVSGLRLHSIHSGMETDEFHVLHVGPLPPGRLTFSFWKTWGTHEERVLEVPASEASVVLAIPVQ